MSQSLSLSEARSIAVASQGLHASSLSTLEYAFSRVKCLQLDPLKAVRESHEMVCLARGVPIEAVTGLFERGSAYTVFAYAAHAMALVPLAMWPWFTFMRRRLRTHGWRGPAVSQDAVSAVRVLLAEHPVLTTKLFRDNTGSGWQRSSPMRIAAEWLLWTGEAISVSRQKNHREYALASRVVPEALLALEPSDEDCLVHLVGEAIDALGIATTEDVADYFRLQKGAVEPLLERMELTRVAVEGWDRAAWLSRRAPALMDVRCERIVPLSPFDSLVWYRPRLQRLFGKAYSFEAYKPAAERTFGHYFVPVLSGPRIIGRVAPRRKKGVIVIEAMECDSPDDKPAIDEAVLTLHRWGTATEKRLSPDASQEIAYEH